MQQARDLLMARGAPITTDNLNRAMTMLTGTGANRTEQTAEGFDMNAQVDRVMQRSTGRPGTARPAAARPAANNVAARADNPPATPVGTPEPAATSTVNVMPPPDRVEALTGAGYQPVMIPGEATSYELPGTGPSANLDGNGMQNRLLRDLLMGAESASIVGGALPLGLGRGAAASPNVVSVGSTITPPRAAPMANAVDLTQALPGVARPAAQTRTVPIRQAVDDVVAPPPTTAAANKLSFPGGVTPPLTPQQVAELSARNPRVAAGFAEARRVPGASAELSPTMQRVLAGPDLPAGLPTGLTPMQRATMMGPSEAGNAAATAARARSAPKPRNMSAAQRQRRQNIAESP